MTRYIIISWAMILFGVVLASLSISGPASALMAVMYFFGSMLMIFPNLLWIYLANKVASARLEQAQLRIITVLLIYTLIAFSIIFGGLVYASSTPINELTGGPAENVLLLLGCSGFITLIAAGIFASRSIVDASAAPHVDRGVRIFGYAVGFFYIAIGMFFIASKLKQLIEADALHSQP